MKRMAVLLLIQLCMQLASRALACQVLSFYVINCVDVDVDVS